MIYSLQGHGLIVSLAPQ